MNYHAPRLEDCFQTRRDFLTRCGLGVGALGLASLLDAAGVLAPSARANVDMTSPLMPRAPHFPAKAKRVIHIFAQGGPSHLDTFDPKPNLTKYDGKLVKEADKNVSFAGTAFGGYAWRSGGGAGFGWLMRLQTH